MDSSAKLRLITIVIAVALGVAGLILYWQEPASPKVLTPPSAYAQAPRATVGALGCVFRPDGKALAALCADKSVRVWDISTWRELCNFEGHLTGKGPTALAFAADGNTVASADEDGSLFLWNPADGKVQTQLQGAGAGTGFLSFSADGKLLASGSDDGVMTIWDVATGAKTKTLEPEANRRLGSNLRAALSPKGDWLVSTGTDSPTTLWDLGVGTPRELRKGLGTAAAFSADGKTLAVAYAGSPRQRGSLSGVVLWNTETGKERVTLETGNPQFLAFLADAHTLLIVHPYGSPETWDVETGKKTADLEPKDVRLRPLGPVMAVSPDGARLAVSGALSGQPITVFEIGK